MRLVGGLDERREHGMITGSWKLLGGSNVLMHAGASAQPQAHHEALNIKPAELSKPHGLFPGILHLPMYLINAARLRLERFDDEAKLPPHAILSHTWGQAEVTFELFTSLPLESSAGLLKIQKTCEQALKDGIFYAWVDTCCCIDKRSSAELSEAINSMFRWYEGASICYAYLEDVTESNDRERSIDAYGIPSELWAANNVDEKSLAASRWFTRGWTLQELIAPMHLTFYGKGWVRLGTREGLKKQIADITRIDQTALGGHLKPHLRSFSVAQRMSWAANRITTRPEDTAYSLLGLFDVNMPLLYGEGDKAFGRLQEEIMKDSNDQSLFAWESSQKFDFIKLADRGDWSSIFAHHPSMFTKATRIVPGFRSSEPFVLTNMGVRIKAPVLSFRQFRRGWSAIQTFDLKFYGDVMLEETLLVVLNCFLDPHIGNHQIQQHVAIVCQIIPGSTNQLARHRTAGCYLLSDEEVQKAELLDVYLAKSSSKPPAGSSPLDKPGADAERTSLGTSYSQCAPDHLKHWKPSLKPTDPTTLPMPSILLAELFYWKVQERHHRR